MFLVQLPVTFTPSNASTSSLALLGQLPFVPPPTAGQIVALLGSWLLRNTGDNVYIVQGRGPVLLWSTCVCVNEEKKERVPLVFPSSHQRY